MKAWLGVVGRDKQGALRRLGMDWARLFRRDTPWAIAPAAIASAAVASNTPANAPLLTAGELAELAAQAAHLARASSRREVHDHHAGDWPSAWLGRGLDFEEARPYTPGDDLRDMDWRTTARLGHPFVKIYREERQPVLHLALDRGPAMRFGTRRRLKAAQAARVAALAAFAAAERNIAVGATLWDGRDIDLPPRHARAGILELVGHFAAPCPPQYPPLPPRGRGRGEGTTSHSAGRAPSPPSPTARPTAGIAPPAGSGGGKPVSRNSAYAPGGEGGLAFTDRLHHLAADLPRGTRLLLISDFAWLDDSHAVPLAHLAERADLLAVRVSDPAERSLPDVGLARFLDIHAGKTRWLDTGSAAARAGHAAAFAERRARADALFARAGVACLDLGSEVDDLIPVLRSHA